jgi:hypothetical protein
MQPPCHAAGWRCEFDQAAGNQPQALMEAGSETVLPSEQIFTLCAKERSGFG